MTIRYEQIQDGVVNLEQLTTPALLQLCLNTDDYRVKNLVDHLLMYSRSCVKPSKHHRFVRVLV